jgi:hypothetical protein
MSYFIPPIESFIQESQDAAKEINPVNVDEAGDVHGLMKAFGEHLQFGVAFAVPEYKAPIAKAGRSTDGVRVDPVAKVDDWDQTIDAPVTKTAPNYIRHRDLTAEEKKIEDVKDAAYTKLIDAGVSVEDARKIVFA